MQGIGEPQQGHHSPVGSFKTGREEKLALLRMKDDLSSFQRQPWAIQTAKKTCNEMRVAVVYDEFRWWRRKKNRGIPIGEKRNKK